MTHVQPSNPGPPPHPAQGGMGQMQGKPKPQPQANSASREDRMDMLQAQQQTLRQTAEALKNELAQLPVPLDDHDGRIAAQRERAQELIDEAIDEMERFERALSKARFEPGQDEALAAEARAALGNAMDLLASAGDALAGQIGYSEEERLAREYEQMARRLARRLLFP